MTWFKQLQCGRLSKGRLSKGIEGIVTPSLRRNKDIKLFDVNGAGSSNKYWLRKGEERAGLSDK